MATFTRGTTPFVLQKGERITIKSGSSTSGAVAVAGETISQAISSNSTYNFGGFDSVREVVVTVVSGSVDVRVSQEGSLPANSKGQIVSPSGVIVPALPGVLRAAVFGSSTDQHCFANAEGTLVVSNGVGTWTSAEGSHYLQSGALVSLNKDNPSTDFQRNRATARATYVSATALRFDLPGWPDGSGLMDAHFLSADIQPSWVRKLRSLCGGTFQVVATMAVGGEQTTPKLAYFRDLLKLDINCVIGAFGIGNDILGGVDTAVTISNMTTMVNELTAAGLVVVVLLPPATANLTTVQEARGQKITNALLALRANNPLLFVADEYGVTIDPMTGQGKSGLFIGDGVHLSRVGKDLVATQAHYPVISPILDKSVTRLISSVNDCASKEATNGQAMTGFWLGTGTAASTLSGKATGTVDANVTAISVGGASAVLNCSLALRADGFGYDQVLEFVPGGNNQSFQISITGFHQYLTAGDYDIQCALSITMDSGMEVFGYAHYVEATVNGVSGRISENYRTENGVGNEPKLITNITENPCIFPPARLTAAPSAGAWVFGLNTANRGTAGNKVTVRIGRPTIRPI